jgi:hypothetical protein
MRKFLKIVNLSIFFLSGKIFFTSQMNSICLFTFFKQLFTVRRVNKLSPFSSLFQIEFMNNNLQSPVE